LTDITTHFSATALFKISIQNAGMILKKVETSIKTYNINKKMNIAGSRGRILFLFFSSI